MTSSFRPTTLIFPAILAAMGTITVASAQSSSPFAKKNKTQAWETAPTPAAPINNSPTNSLPVNAAPNPLNNYEYRAPRQPQTAPIQAAPIQPRPVQSNPVQTYSPQPKPQAVAPNWQDLQNSSQNATPADITAYYPGRRNGGARTAKPRHDIGTYESSPHSARHEAQHSSSSPFSPRATGRQPQVQYHNDGRTVASPSYGDPNRPQWGQPQGQAYQDQAYQGQAYQNQAPNQNYGQQPQYSQDQGRSAQAYQASPQKKRSWKDRLGLSRWQTIFRGSAAVGAAAVENPNGTGGWGAEFIGDTDLDVEVSTITQGGLEYGATIGGRAQYDRFRRGFGQRLPDCPPTELGCSTAVINGTPTGLRGHTSQFFSDGADDARAGEIQLETAYVFLRSAYGDVTLGRDDGSAYLFSLGAPSLLKVGASNSPVDYTGFDSVKTVNDASGFAEKVTYTSPRLLGDTVGVGVQLGVSYAPNALGCGVDNCIRSNADQGSGTIAAELRNVVEVGVALDRNFGNGFKAELTGSYARADERSGFAGLDDLEAFNAGLELTYNDWILGGSYLNSNNGLENGDYEAYDVGLTWKPSKLGFTLGYGHATDDNVNLTSDQAIFGVSYDFSKISIGAGVQYIDRTTSVFDGLNVTSQSEDATAIFIETGFKF